MKNIVGLDVSKGKSYYVIYSDRNCLSEGIITHNQDGFKKLQKIINQLTSPVEIVFEATGNYSRPLRKFCLDNHYTFFEMNPLLAKNQTIGPNLRRQKNDRVDAHKLAQSHLIFERKEFLPEEKIYAQLKAVERLYQEVSEKLRKAKNHLHACLQLTFPELDKLVSGNSYTRFNVQVVNAYPHPELIKEATIDDLIDTFSSFTHKNMSHKQHETKAKKLIEMANVSYPAVGVDAMELDSTRYYTREVLFLEEEKAQLTAKKDHLAKQIPEYDIFRSLPGVGEVTAAGLLAESGDLTRFETSNQLNAFVGIDLRSYQSGQYVASDHINKRGNKYARKLLYQVIRNMVKCRHIPNHIIDYYYRLKKQPQPKKDKVAIVACMNKLLKCLHSQVRNGTLYDYSYTVSMDH